MMAKTARRHRWRRVHRYRTVLDDLRALTSSGRRRRAVATRVDGDAFDIVAAQGRVREASLDRGVTDDKIACRDSVHAAGSVPIVIGHVIEDRKQPRGTSKHGSVNSEVWPTRVKPTCTTVHRFDATEGSDQ